MNFAPGDLVKPATLEKPMGGHLSTLFNDFGEYTRPKRITTSPFIVVGCVSVRPEGDCVIVLVDGELRWLYAYEVNLLQRTHDITG